MADALRLVRVTRHEVGYVWATQDEVDRGCIGRPHPNLPTTLVDGDVLLDFAARVVDAAEDYPTAELVTFDEDGDPEGVEDWHNVPERPEGADRG